MKLVSGAEAGRSYVNAVVVEANRTGRVGRKKVGLIRRRCHERTEDLQRDLDERVRGETMLEDQVAKARRQLRKRLKRVNLMTRSQLLQQRERDIAHCAVEAVDLPGIALNPNVSGTVGPLKRIPPSEQSSPYANLCGAQTSATSQKSLSRADRVLCDSHWMRIIAAENERMAAEDAEKVVSRRKRNKAFTADLDSQRKEFSVRREECADVKRRERAEAEQHHQEWLESQQQRKIDAKQRCLTEQQESTALLARERTAKQAQLALQKEQERESSNIAEALLDASKKAQRDTKLKLQKAWKEQLQQRAEQRQAEKIQSAPIEYIEPEPLLDPRAALFAKRDRLEKMANESFRIRQTKAAEASAREDELVKKHDTLREADDLLRRRAIVTRNQAQAAELSLQIKEKQALDASRAAEDQEHTSRIERYNSDVHLKSLELSDRNKITHMKHVMTLDLQRSLKRANDMRGLLIKIK